MDENPLDAIISQLEDLSASREHRRANLERGCELLRSFRDAGEPSLDETLGPEIACSFNAIAANLLAQAVEILELLADHPRSARYEGLRGVTAMLTAFAAWLGKRAMSGKEA